MSNRLLVKTVAIACTLLAAVLPATLGRAAEYPDRPVKILIGYPPGGPTDVIGRLVADQMAEMLGKPVVIENRPGAGSNIATQAVATSAPDGYTLLIGSFANAVNPSLMPVPYDTKRDLVPISMAARVPIFIVAPGNAPYSNIRELIAAAKSKPGVLNYATGGIGSSSHLAAELFKRRAGVDITTVHYKGGAPALQDVIAGRMDLFFDQPQTSMGFIKEGRVKLLAVTTAQRLSWLPEAPTVAESGLPGFEVLTWVGLFGRAGTPPAVIEKLQRAVATAVASPKVQERFKTFGIEPVGSTTAEFTAFIHRELDAWEKVIREGNIKVE